MTWFQWHVAAFLAIAILFGGPAAPAQTRDLVPAETPDAVLRQMTGEAAVIFTGTVLSVRQANGSDGATGEVEIDFAVDRAIRGCASGQTYTLREWGGLWEGTGARYKAGQRLLMLLHAPSASGLSSPVHGMDGAIPIRGGGGSPTGGAAAGSGVAEEPRVDLRWVAARASRGPIKYRPETPRIPRLRKLAEVLPMPGTVTTVEPESTGPVPAAPVPAQAPVSSTAAQEAGVDAVVARISGWIGGAR